MFQASKNQIENLISILDGYFGNCGENSGAQHLNVNVLQLEDLRRACEDPEHYGDLVVRISGYAIRVAELTDEQRAELLQRTLHSSM